MTHARKLAGLGAVVLLAVTSVACGSSGSSHTADSPGTVGDIWKSSDFGTLKNVCHKATGRNTPGPNGVTADSIKLTTISDAGSELQKGLNQELWDTATVFTRWCNENGGINGRRIDLIQGDAQVLKYKDVIDQACTTSFALVGGGGAMDNLGEADRVKKCKLPNFPGFTASAEARGAPLSYPAMATGLTNVTGGGLKYLKATYGADEPIATVYGAFATTQFTMDLRLSAAQAVGLASTNSPVNGEPGDDGKPHGDTYSPLGIPDWRPTAESILSSDPAAKGVLFSGQPLDLGKLLTALGANSKLPAAKSGKPQFWAFADENAYDQVVIRTGRTGLAKVPLYVQSFIYPFEEAGQGAKSKAMDDFLALFDHYLPNGKSRAMFAVSGFASWLLFVQAASACGNNLTRTCVVSKVKDVGTFDAGGLIAPRDPSDPTKSSECFVLLKATPNGFERVNGPSLAPTPGEGRGVFNCGPQNIVTVTDSPLMQQWQEAVTKMFGTTADAGG